MRLARLKQNVNSYEAEVVTVRGINYSDRTQAGDLAEAENLSTRRYPFMTTRKARQAVAEGEAITGLYSWDKLVTVDGTALKYDGEVVGAVSPGEKQFAVVGDKLCVYPDKVSVSVKDRTFDRLDKKLVTPAGAVLTSSTLTVPDATLGKEAVTTLNFAKMPTDTFFFKTYTNLEWQNGAWVKTGEARTGLEAANEDQLCIPKKVGYDSWTIDWATGAEEIEENNEGYYGVITEADVTAWSESGAIVFSLKEIKFDVYNAAAQKFVFTGSFTAGEKVIITGITTGGASEVVANLTAVNENVLTFEDGTFTAGTNNGTLTVRKNVPDLDFICGANGRLWGISNADNTVYASALGKPDVFDEFQGLSTDSYALEIISKGEFTGICEYGDAILLWKEDKLHKIMGDMPSQYYMYTYDIEGVETGGHKSLQVINETLFYVGSSGVYTYAGNTPVKISDRFGNRAITEAVAGTDGQRYYMSAKVDGVQGVFVFDTDGNLWTREDGARAADFARLGKDLYFAAGNKVWLADSGQDDSGIMWSAQFTPFYETLQGNKIYSKLIIRMELPQGSWVKAEVRYDGGDWKNSGVMVGKKHDTVSLRLPIMRCDKFELRLSGEGPGTVLGITREFMVGSDV